MALLPSATPTIKLTENIQLSLDENLGAGHRNGEWLAIGERCTKRFFAFFERRY
jgi:hypothetical protein